MIKTTFNGDKATVKEWMLSVPSLPHLSFPLFLHLPPVRSSGERCKLPSGSKFLMLLDISVEAVVRQPNENDSSVKSSSNWYVTGHCKSSLILSVNRHHIHDLVSVKGKTKEVYCCDIVVLIILFWCFWCMKDYNVVSVYIETLSDEAVKRYQSADFCFPLCQN